MLRGPAVEVKRKFQVYKAKALVNRLKAYTMCDFERIKSLINLSLYLNSRRIEGDFVECGTYKGGTAAILSKYMGADKHLYLYDSFKGMPPTSDKDGAEAAKWVGGCRGTVEDVREAMKLVSTDDSRYTIVEGWFENTFREILPEKVAFLHCDADWYNSVTLVLDTFYPLISKGGCVVLDDFGYWEGCREAFYDFCVRHNEKPLLERVGVSQAYWIKHKLNNRA
jgi:O-methyltransferase